MAERPEEGGLGRRQRVGQDGERRLEQRVVGEAELLPADEPADRRPDRHVLAP